MTMFVYRDVPGIDPEKLYRATFIRQCGLCCCNMAPVSFLLFCKKFGARARIFWANGLRPPPPRQKIFRTPMHVTYKIVCHILNILNLQ